MSQENDAAQTHALMVLAGVVALVVAGVIALATGSTLQAARKGPARNAAASAGAAEAGITGRIDFAGGSAGLPNGAAAILERVADAARADPNRVVQIASHHAGSGDALQEAELAKQRAEAVRHALEANGVAPAQLQMDAPVPTTGSVDGRAGGRVELRVQ